MDLSRPFVELLQDELSDRHELLCRAYGRDNVIPPRRALLEALDALTEPGRQNGDPRSVAECLRYAGETYEYLVRRLQDPRWRTIVGLAFEMGPARRSVRVPQHSGPAWRSSRPAGSFSRELTVGAEETPA